MKVNVRVAFAGTDHQALNELTRAEGRPAPNVIRDAVRFIHWVRAQVGGGKPFTVLDSEGRRVFEFGGKQ